MCLDSPGGEEKTTLPFYLALSGAGRSLLMPLEHQQDDDIKPGPCLYFGLAGGGLFSSVGGRDAAIIVKQERLSLGKSWST